MKKNKRRTLVTIIGVIISVAMVTAVSTLVVSFMDLLQRQTMAETGEWHVKYENVDHNQFLSIQANNQTKDVFISRDIGYAYLEGSDNDHKPYVYLMEFDQKGFEKYPIHLTAGRLPENEQEILLSEHIASNGRVTFEIGDEVTWEIGQRVPEDPELSGFQIDQTFALMEEEEDIKETLTTEETRTMTVVGFIERPPFEPTWAPGYTVISYTDEISLTEHRADVSVIVNKVNRSIFKKSEELAETLNIKSYETNRELLRFHGAILNEGVFTALVSIVSIIMLIIMIGSVSLIYNAFAISVSERSRHLGMLSSVGATKVQKRNSVFFEGFIISLISIPLGIMSGLLGIGVTFYVINDRLMSVLELNEKLMVTITPFSIILSSILSIITIFLSTYIPARRASKVSAIDAIRQTMDIKLTRKSVKTSRLVRWVFGFEAEIGLKNLKRNKKRYMATVFSLVISIVLFLSVAYFTRVIDQTNDMMAEGIDYDINVMLTAEEFSDDQQVVIDTIKQMPEVTKAQVVHKTHLEIAIDQVHVPDIVLKANGAEDSEDKILYYTYINVLEEDALIEYAKDIGVRPELLMKTDQMTAIIPNKLTYYSEADGKYVEEQAVMVNPGEKISLDLFDFNGKPYGTIDHLEILTTTDTFPMGVSPLGVNGVNLIVSESTFNQMLAYDLPSSDVNMYLESTDPLKTEEDINELDPPSSHVFNHYKVNQDDKEMNFIISVFTYGFITLITLISVANIFNTISTSISLRKREFGMLKSVGMTPRGFSKMIRYESLFYGIKALLYGLPISLGLMYLMYRAMTSGFLISFQLPWIHIVIVVVAVFLIVSLSMMYASAKVKKENIIDALKQENI